MPTLSVVIPARNEMWLSRTVEDILAHIEADTEVIVVLDGAWADPPLVQHERVHVVYLPESIGQRAATNLGVRISDARYVMKADGHVAFDQGFDRKLIEAAEQLGPDVTQIPAQKNLHVWDWICDACGVRRYQGPSSVCIGCNGEMRQEVVWKARRGTTTTSWYFDTQPKFGYWGRGAERQSGDICDVMTSLGACFFMSRERFWQIGGLDEKYGSWGSLGIEVACKSWLSGGRHVVNKRTHFSHFFRVGGIGFPYPISGADQERARQHARDVWFNNAWPGQVRPLLWLIEKFAPLPGWHDPDGAETLGLVRDAARTFEITAPVPVLGEDGGVLFGSQGGSIPALALAPDLGIESGDVTLHSDSLTPNTDALAARSLNDAVGVPSAACVGTHPAGVLTVRDEFQMGGVDTVSPLAEVIDLNVGVHPDRFHQPRVGEAMGSVLAVGEEDAVAGVIDAAVPQPAARVGVKFNASEESADASPINAPDGEILGVSHESASIAGSGLGADTAFQRGAAPLILAKSPTKSIIYYSDCRADPAILEGCRRSIERSGLPIIAVTLKPIDWPAATNIVVPMERGYLTLFKQILIGLVAAQSDVVFFAEHDCWYHDSHWSFTPPSGDCYWYQMAWWKVDVATGKAVTYVAKQTSQLCAHRQLLIEHYRKRVARVERDGFSRRQGFEPGSHGRKERIDDVPSDVWRSSQPNLDLRHAHNLTPSRWDRSLFRDQRHCQGWQETTINLSEVLGAVEAVA